MVKKFSIEFKQQSVDYALSNAHLSISELANHLGVGKSTLDKWIRQCSTRQNPTLLVPKRPTWHADRVNGWIW